MSAALLVWLKAALIPFLTGFATAFIKEWLRDKALADAGAAAQRSVQDQADAEAAIKAKGVADALQATSGGDFAARAGYWR
jgi:hypothetical protein